MPPIWAATFSPDTGSRSAITTFAPSSAKRIAVALPMPLEPPVITATRSCNASLTSYFRFTPEFLRQLEFSPRCL